MSYDPVTCDDVTVVPIETDKFQLFTRVKKSLWDKR